MSPPRDSTEIGRSFKFNAAVTPIADEAFVKHLKEKTAYSCAKDEESDDEQMEAEDAEKGDGKALLDPENVLERAKQKRTKKEDVSWIQEQIAAQSAAGFERPLAAGEPWWTLVDCGEEEWLAKVDQEIADKKDSGTFVVNPMFCCSRAWGGGWGGQCTVPRQSGSDYCKAHLKQIEKQGFLTHGRIDGPIPPKKREEMEAFQRKLLKDKAAGKKGGGGSSVHLTDVSGGFSEDNWRQLQRGQGESLRAYAYRTGRDEKELRAEEPATSSSSSRKKVKEEGKEADVKKESGASLERWFKPVAGKEEDRKAALPLESDEKGVKGKTLASFFKRKASSEGTENDENVMPKKRGKKAAAIAGAVAAAASVAEKTMAAVASTSAQDLAKGYDSVEATMAQLELENKRLREELLKVEETKALAAASQEAADPAGKTPRKARVKKTDADAASTAKQAKKNTKAAAPRSKPAAERPSQTKRAVSTK